LQRFFFANGFSAHNKVFDYARGRFNFIFKEPDDTRGGRPNLQIYSKDVDNEFMEYLSKLSYNACSGDASQIAALENKKYFIDFLDFCDNYLEKVDRINKQNDKLNKK
jgi:hypothetical protein